MKLINTIFTLAAGVALSICATSCNSSTNDEDQSLKYQQDILNAFVHANNMAEDVTIDYQGANYKIIYDFTKGTSEVSITGLRLPGGTQFTTINLTGLTFKIDDNGTRVVEGKNPMATVSNFASAPLFNSFKLTVTDRYFDSSYRPTNDITMAKYYVPVISVIYTIDGKYRVVSGPVDQLFRGTTVTTDPAGNSFSNSDPYYILALDMESKTAKLTLNQVQFVQAMPAMSNMTFANLPFTIGNNGVITIEKSETTVPTIGDVPYPSFPITNLKATYNLAEGMDLDFNCDVKGQPHSVSAKLPFFTPKQ